MKKLLRVLVYCMCLILLASSTALADETFVKVNWLGKYVLSNGQETYGHKVIQGEVGHIFDNNIGLSVWGSLPASFKDIGDNTATEIDLNAWYTYKLVTIGVSYYAFYPNETSFYKNDVVQFNGELKKDFAFGKATVTPGFRVEYYIPVSGNHDTNNTGLYLMPLTRFNYQFNEKWSAGIEAKFTYDVSGFGLDQALIGKFSPKVAYNFNKNITANAGMEIYAPIFKRHDDPRKDYYVPCVGLNYAF